MYELDSLTGEKNKVSILIASLREEELLKRLKEFDDIAIEVDYEIVVVSPFQVNHPKVIWIKELERNGNVYAMQQAFEHSTGNYIIFLADDVSPTKECIDNMFRFVRERPEPFLGAFMMFDKIGQKQDSWYIYDRLYACYGCIARKYIKQIGGFFDIRFKHSWCDPDLSTRVWLNGGKVENCSTAKIINLQIEDEIHCQNSKEYFSQDTKSFITKWSSILNIPSNALWGSFNTGKEVDITPAEDSITFKKNLIKKEKYYVTPYNKTHKPLISFLISCRVFDPIEFQPCPLNWVDTERFNLYTLLNTLKLVSNNNSNNNIEILLKIDEDNELALEEYIYKNTLIEKYSSLNIRPIIYNRWEGRNSLYQDYMFLFTRKNPSSKFVGILSDDAYVFKNVIPNLEGNLDKEYAIFTSHVSTEAWNSLEHWKKDTYKYRDGALTEPYPIVTTKLLEIMGNTGFQNNIDSSFTLISVIMKIKYGIDLRIGILPWIMRGNKNIVTDNYGSNFNEEFCISIDQIPTENSYFWALAEWQANNIYLNMKKEGLINV